MIARILLLFSALLLLAPFAHAGGIIQEFRTSKDSVSQSSHSLTSSSSSAPPLGPQYTTSSNPTRPPHTSTCQKPKIVVIYNEQAHSASLSWSPSTFQDQAPLRYLIYRRHIHETTWTLIATVNGQTLTFLDTYVPGPSHLYVYRVEAVYSVAGRTFSVPYFQAEMPKAAPSIDSFDPPAGVGCHLTPLSSLPSFGLFFFLVLPLLLRRRRR